MAEGGEKSDENVVDEDLVVKRNRLILDSGETTCYKHSYCVKHAEQLLQLLEETQPTSITSFNTTIKTYTNNSKPALAIINCIVNNMQTSLFVYLFVSRPCPALILDSILLSWSAPSRDFTSETTATSVSIISIGSDSDQQVNPVQNQLAEELCGSRCPTTDPEKICSDVRLMFVLICHGCTGFTGG